MKQAIKKILNQLPYIKTLHRQVADLKKNMRYSPGHFYSPIIDIEALKNKEDQIWKSKSVEQIEGIELHTPEQLDLLAQLTQYYPELPFEEAQNEKTRYYLENGLYSYTDAILLYALIRHLKPKKIIEIGSGFSSAVMLDTNNLFLNNTIDLTFIEPYPNRLFTLLTAEDKEKTQVIISEAQEVNTDLFKQLEANDILFVDSTHVSKTGSDVNYILFDILPKLKSGVWIHFHDIFHPFEYPKEWVYEGRNWNEDYILRAFLMYNPVFKIRFFADYLHTFYSEAFAGMPLCYRNFGGNLWIQKQ